MSVDLLHVRSLVDDFERATKGGKPDLACSIARHVTAHYVPRLLNMLAISAALQPDALAEVTEAAAEVPAELAPTDPQPTPAMGTPMPVPPGSRKQMPATAIWGRNAIEVWPEAGESE